MNSLFLLAIALRNFCRHHNQGSILAVHLSIKTAGHYSSLTRMIFSATLLELPEAPKTKGDKDRVAKLAVATVNHISDVLKTW